MISEKGSIFEVELQKMQHFTHNPESNSLMGAKMLQILQLEAEKPTFVAENVVIFAR
ncbi:hypothetical protein GCM10007362_35610 [Saccharibacillus endophyticus]|uniref:Uncharacterized protein n=1 Tax=Saccharibacillus endophyticus TaxID=2060666 RepID=A0ABQ2A2L4_9BACL|nr:hypothetical protein GCM10007362_35610 [Saccharibacillus endophyticus]